MMRAIVLAAGRSSRMKTQKLLLPFGGGTVIGYIVDQLLGSALDEVVVVVGHDGERVAEALASRAVRVVTNPDYASGMLSTVRCGLRALAPCDGVLVALGDQPAITSALVDELVGAFARAGKGILVPLHDGMRGHPPLFAARYQDELLTRYDDVGLRGLLTAHPEDVLELSVPTDAVLSDMDYPEDYQQELARLRKGTTTP
jgi:molybdenum cofactor cytidylyltransferase